MSGVAAVGTASVAFVPMTKGMWPVQGMHQCAGARPLNPRSPSLGSPSATRPALS